MLSVDMLSVDMLSVIMLGVIMLCVIMLSVIMLSAFMQSVVMLNVVAPQKQEVINFKNGATSVVTFSSPFSIDIKDSQIPSFPSLDIQVFPEWKGQ